MANHRAATKLLVSGSEEPKHHWGVSPYTWDQDGQLSLRPSLVKEIHMALLNEPLMRLWDENSGSHPDEDGRMLARDSIMALGTFQARKESLANHARYDNWDHPTPYISFCKSPETVKKRATNRAKIGRRGQKLTVINPSVKLVKGLPIVNMHAEMLHYGVQDPYGRDYEFYEDDYLCFWEVMPSDIVGHWDWDDLSAKPNWYEDEILPALEDHERAHATRVLAGGGQPTAPLVLRPGWIVITAEPVEQETERPKVSMSGFAMVVRN